MNTQSTQRFVSDIAPRRYASRLGSTHGTATQLNSTICLLPRYLTRRSAAPLDPTQRFVYYDATRLMALLRSSALLNSTICLLRRVAPHGAAPYRNVAQLNSTICLLRRNKPRLDVSPRVAPQRNSTICLLPTHLPRVAPPQVAPPRVSTRRFVFDSEPQLGTTKRNSTQRNR
jgi:hypothetical protein